MKSPLFLRSSPTILTGLILFFLTSWATFAQASNTPQRAPASTLQPIDTLQDRLEKSKKSPGIVKLQKAYDLVQEGKTAEAKKLLAQIQKDPEFSDYGYWMAAQLALDEARRSEEPVKAAQRALNHGLVILKNHPYSPFFKLISREMGQAELILGAASCGPKKWNSCKAIFESGFQRLSLNGDLGFCRPKELEKYGEACAAEPSEFCGSWLTKLSSIFSKSSPEHKALMKSQPALPEKGKGLIGSGRLTKSYKSPDLDQAAFDAALFSYLEQKYPAAAIGFRQFLDDFPRSTLRFRSEYWLAQALSHEQKHEEAKKLYEQLQAESPLTYYGLLASIASGHDLSTSIEASVPQATESDRALSPSELFRIKRAEKLIQGGAPKLAAFELKDLKSREGLTSSFLLYLALLNHEAGNHNISFSILGELIQRQHESITSTYTLRLIFPTPYLELIESQAAENKLDPILVLSLIKQESSFDAAASSSTGAQGLMQLMPTTALDVFSDLHRSEMIVPKTNIRTGTKYLGRLMNRFNGNIVLALAAYNAGPGAVDRWVKAAPPKRGMLEFIEAIPFKETREYVAAIIRNYFWYSRRLNSGEKIKSLNYFWNLYGPPEKPGELPSKGASPLPEEVPTSS